MPRTMKHLLLVLAALLIDCPPQRALAAESDSTVKKPAVVIVRLPADAELFIGEVKSEQQTAIREFDTPPLALGKKFSYPLKAVWKEGEKEVTHARTIFVMGGETTHIDLVGLKLSPPIAEKLPTPHLMPELDPKPASSSEPEKKPQIEPPPIKKAEPKPEPKIKPDPKPETIKKPEVKPEPEKKPEPKPEPEKKPELKPEKKPEPKPLPEKKPEPEPEKKPEPKPLPQKKPEPKPERVTKPPKAVAPEPSQKSTLALVMPETLNLQPGGTKLLPIKVIRMHCDGPVRISFEGLPSGVEMKNATVAAGKQKVYVQATAAAGTEEKEWEVKVIGIGGTARQEALLKIKIAK